MSPTAPRPPTTARVPGGVRTGGPRARAAPRAADGEGQYQSPPLNGARNVKVSIAREGYKPMFETEVVIDAAKPTVFDVALEQDVKKSKFEVSATANKKPIKADIAFTGAAEAKLQTVTTNGKRAQGSTVDVVTSLNSADRQEWTVKITYKDGNEIKFKGVNTRKKE